MGNDFNIIPSNRISMKDVDFPVLGIDNLGNTQLMHPGGEYEYQGDYVTELPMYGSGGLTQWFAEEWVDIKTGKKCGRSGKDKKGRPYPACRPSKRVNKTTPKTKGEMSAAEKAKFKRKKKSGKRIDYNHKRELGGSLPKAQEGNGETPLTRKEIFNVPRTMAYEDGKMVVQDKPIWDGFLDETTVTASRLPSPEFNLGPQATISQYTPPSNREYLLNKLENPMTALGYILGGKDMPNKIGRENAFDYAVDVVNPLTYINTLGDIYESVSEGDIIGAGIDAITLAPIVPTAVKQGKNLLRRSVQVGNKYVSPLSYKRLYQFNPFANQRPPFITVVRTQMPGQTGKLVMGQYYDDLASQGKKLNWRQNLDRNSSRRFGWGRGFSSDAGDIINYSRPSMTAYRGYDSNLINPELLIKRLPTSYLDDFMVANLSSNAQKAYGSGKKFSEFILPIEDVISAETRALSKEAYDEIRNIRNAELTPHWLKGFQEVKALGGSLPSYQTRGEVNFQSLDPRLQNGYNSTDATYVRQDLVNPYIVNRSETQRLIDESVPQTITTYVPPEPKEWLLNKAANPVATLGYIARGQRIPDRINNDNKENALDYAFDIINPGAWANYAAQSEKDFLSGDIVGGTLNAISAIPAVPAAAGTATKTTFNLAKGTPIKSSFNLVKTAAPASKPATLISGRLPEGVKKWIRGLDQGQVPEYIIGIEKGINDVLGIGVPRRPFFETFPITRSQRLAVEGLQDAAALEAEAFVKAYTHDGTQLQPWVVRKLEDWAPGATWQTNLRNQPHLRNKRVVLTDTRLGRRSPLLTAEEAVGVGQKRIDTRGFANMGLGDNMITYRNQGWYFNRPSDIAEVVAHEGAHGLPQSILDTRGIPLGTHMSVWNDNLNYFANPAYNPKWASSVTDAHNVTKNFTPNPFQNPSRAWDAAPIEFDAEKLATRFKLYKDWQSKGANMSPETFLRLESESINPFRLNKIPGMSGPIGFDPEAFQAYYKGQLSRHLINPNMPVREFNTMNKFYRRGGQLPRYQTKGETPLTRDEIFNIPRTIRYENSDMVVQDKPIWDGMLDEVTVTPTTASEYAWQENRANQSTGGLEPVYPIFDLMSSGLRAPLTKGAKAVQGALTSEKTLGALARSQYVPKFTKPSLIKNYKSRFPNVDLRGTGTGNYSKLGVNELGLGVDDFGSLTNYERSAISQVNQTQPADEVFNTFVQRYADFNTDNALANQLADFSRRNPRTKFEINLGRDVTPSKKMQEIFNDPELNVHNVFSYESSGPINFVNKWGNESRRFYDSSARNAAGEFEKNLRSYGQQGFYAANVPMGKPVKQALTYNKDGRVFDYVRETVPVSDFVVNKGLMNPDVIGNFSRYRGAGDMANQHNFLLGITNSPSVIISGNKGFAGLKGGNKIRERIGGLITPTGGKAVSSHNKQVVPLLKQEFNLSKPFEGTFMKSPSILETYYNSRGQASPYTNFPGILDIDDLFTTGKSQFAKGGELSKAQLGNGEKHTVESGETFYGIANQNGIAWEDLVSANPGIDIEKLSVGQIINIPSVSKSGGVKITYSDPELNILQQERELGNIKQSEPEQVEEVKITKQPVETKTTQAYDGPGYFPEALLLKQAYKESTFNPAAQSKIKNPAQGFAQFRPITVRELQRLGFADETFDPFDYTQSIGAQRDYMNYLYTRPWIDKPNQSEEVRLAKTLAAYNWGPEVFKTFLTNKKAAGVDIYNSLDWVDQLPGETGDYINKILLDSDEQFQADYQKALKDTANLKYINLYNLKAGGESLPAFDDYDTFDRAWLAARKKLGRGKQFMYGGKVRSTDT